MELKEWQANRLWYIDTIYPKRSIPHCHRMVIIRIHDGTLLIHNPIELTPQVKKILSELGQVSAIICASPSYHHHLSDWWLTYDQAHFYATPTSVQKRTDINFDGALSQSAPVLWKGDLYQTALLGFSKPRKILFCDPVSRTLLLSDHLLAIQDDLPLSQKLFTWAHGIHREMKLPYSDKRHLDNMTSLRSSIQEVMTWPFERLLSTNGLTVDNDAKNSFYQAFWWAF